MIAEVFFPPGPRFFPRAGAYAVSWRRRWFPRTVVFDFLRCRVCDQTAISAIDDACAMYASLGITLALRRLSADARALLVQAGRLRPSAVVLLVEDDDDPVYTVAADDAAPADLRAAQLKVNEPPRLETVIVRPDEPAPAPSKPEARKRPRRRHRGKK